MLDNKKNIIGVFDSGLGGLSILKYFLKELPNYHYYYLGDNARLPYGSKSPETIYQYTREAVDFLFKAGCNLIIIACNTATAQALRRLQTDYLPKYYPHRRLLGVIRPIAEEIANNKNSKRIGVLGTKATITSNAYEIELKKIKPSLKVISQSAPLLVPLIEENWLNRPETKMILAEYLRPLKKQRVDTVILGCTHFPFLYQEIVKIMGKKVFIPNPGALVAKSLKDYLNRHPELGLKPVKKPVRKYYTTDNPKLFKDLAERFLAEKINTLKQVRIEAQK
jgi:glutamate racemase